MQYPGRPPQPIHSVSLSVEVWQEPTVQLNSGTQIYTQIKAGETITREISVSNTGDEAIPVNPRFNAEDRRRRRPGGRTTLDRSWVRIEEPSEIAPGETETITLTVKPPADAERGDYRATVDLGLTDPARNADNTYWQEVDLNFQVWTPPEEPFETTFDVGEATTNATLELTANQRQRADDRGQDASFDVTFVAPDGREIAASRVRRTDSGSVNLGARRPRETTDNTYAPRSSQQTFTYEIADPAAGEWSVRITPRNTVDFSYKISRNEAN
ncbi:MAG: NPCBM-associated, NEW3 domain of alpha-galactosidase [Halonotius sp. J07HN4]|nr:MAG: NPCBM-associated, NEW3 domain of alpha-galactosidase [Halonotius sp. J07HN4]